MPAAAFTVIFRNARPPGVIALSVATPLRTMDTLCSPGITHRKPRNPQGQTLACGHAPARQTRRPELFDRGRVRMTRSPAARQPCSMPPPTDAPAQNTSARNNRRRSRQPDRLPADSDETKRHVRRRPAFHVTKRAGGGRQKFNVVPVAGVGKSMYASQCWRCQQRRMAVTATDPCVCLRHGFRACRSPKMARCSGTGARTAAPLRQCAERKHTATAVYPRHR